MLIEGFLNFEDWYTDVDHTFSYYGFHQIDEWSEYGNFYSLGTVKKRR